MLLFQLLLLNQFKLQQNFQLITFLNQKIIFILNLKVERLLYKYMQELEISEELFSRACEQHKASIQPVEVSNYI